MKNMEITEIPTILWTPRNENPNLLERKIDKQIEEENPLPQINYFPIYLPVEKLRRIISGINILV